DEADIAQLLLPEYWGIVVSAFQICPIIVVCNVGFCGFIEVSSYLTGRYNEIELYHKNLRYDYREQDY
ncbi:MAG: hypothetical protein K2I61_04410, partial [Muribaculaceae bacterium]|nr:hypothetical protein [Muribaculaceae bacterium]